MVRSVFIFLLFTLFCTVYRGQVIFLAENIKRQNPVIYYSYKGDKQKVNELLKSNPKLASQKVKYDPQKGVLEEIGDILLTIFTLGFYDGSSSVNPIEAAVAGGHYEIVKMLMARGVRSESVIANAAYYDKRKILDSLVLNYKDGAYDLAKYAIQKNEVKYLKIAIDEYHLDPNSLGPNGEDPLLMVAVAKPCEPDNKLNNPLNYLLSLKGIDLNVKDTEGNTAVMMACNGGSNCTRPCSLLVNAGADLNVMNKNGYTLLDKTMSVNNPNGSEFLISKGAKSSGWEGFRAIERGDKFYRFLETRNYAELDKMKRDSLPYKFRDGLSFKQILTKYINDGDVKGLNYMKGFNFNWNDSIIGYRSACPGKIPYVAFAVCTDNIRLLNFLLENGASAHVKNKDSLNLIQIAIKNSNRPLEFIDVLKKASVDINATDRNGETSVFYLAETNNFGKVQIFLGHGGDPNIADRTGATVLDRIYKNRSLKKMKKFLKSHGALTAKQMRKKAGKK